MIAKIMALTKRAKYALVICAFPLLTLSSSSTFAASVVMSPRQAFVQLQPPNPPAPGEKWEQVTPYLWHYYKRFDETRQTEKWYTMGREGLQWQVDNLIIPRIKELEAKLAADPTNENYQKALAAYQNKLERILSDIDEVGSYYSDKVPLPIQDAPTACNYATTYASIGSQITGGGQACSTSGSNIATYYEWELWRGGGYESGSDNNPYWAAFGLLRAKIANAVCRIESSTGAWWGPFYWDRQDSYEWAEDSDCQ